MTVANAHFPSLKRRGGCAINKMAPFRYGAAGVVSSAKSSGLNNFAELPLRLRPIGLALRATPSVALQPPLLLKEGK